MWKVKLHKDPTLFEQQRIKRTEQELERSHIIELKTSLSNFFTNPKQTDSIAKEVIRNQDHLLHVFHTSLCDLIARTINEIDTCERDESAKYMIKTLDYHSNVKNERKKRKENDEAKNIPFILKRSDIWYDKERDGIIALCRLYWPCNQEEIIKESSFSIDLKSSVDNEKKLISFLIQFLSSLQTKIQQTIMPHVACIFLQEGLREKLKHINAVAFIANGAILPRANSQSQAPMSKAIPFCIQDKNSNLHASIEIEMEKELSQHLSPAISPSSSTAIILSGLLIPKGITLIVGGAFHGKSTLLQTISFGIYNKILYDGREFCVTNSTALSIRAEDGRYVPPSSNLSAFLSELPNPNLEIKHFHCSQASGSTSQAVNVMEALEFSSKLLLMDEDLCATNFMCRDGRMRALIQNESLTPLLYRINALYETLDISSIVVIGGMGDWLDVPHHVIMLDGYRVRDVTERAKSVSETFSYGHVQYKGKGVVHCLDWNNDEMGFFDRCICKKSLEIFHNHKVEFFGGKSLNFSCKADHSEDRNEMMGVIDLNRCGQILLEAQYILGCGCIISFLLKKFLRKEEMIKLSIPDVLREIEKELTKYDGNFNEILFESNTVEELLKNHDFIKLISSDLGFVYQPHINHVGLALFRLRGIQFEILPNVELEQRLEKERLEKERKQRELMEMWNARKKK